MLLRFSWLTFDTTCGQAQVPRKVICTNSPREKVRHVHNIARNGLLIWALLPFRKQLEQVFS